MIKPDSQLLNFAHNLTVLRQQHGLSKTALAKQLHTTVHTLTCLENQDVPRGMGVEVLFYAAERFGFHAYELLEMWL